MALLAFVLEPLAAQSPESILERSPYSQEEQQQIRLIFEYAGEIDLPIDLLTPRLVEGIAKRVSAGRLVTALELEVTRLVTVRELLEDVEADELLADDAIWARAANLLAIDVDGSTVQTLALASHASDPASFRPASALLVSLIDWGVEEGAATALATASAASALDPDEYPVVLDLLIAGRARRFEVDEMTEALLDALPEVRSSRELRRRVPW